MEVRARVGGWNGREHVAVDTVALLFSVRVGGGPISDAGEKRIRLVGADKFCVDGELLGSVRFPFGKCDGWAFEGGRSRKQLLG